ncbi:MAG: transposase [Propionicimonas sp.]|uniref:transposase n=1 Tax=Propionicimonas sp. TaxID=1955623 RepID=UPI003D09CF5D
MTLRGVNRDAIFLEDADYLRFLDMLSTVQTISGCRVLAYCLMPNHVHLVLLARDEPIGLVVKRLAVRYAGWFNYRYGRVGHLFQDRFGSRPVETDSYLATLIRYVWANPVASGLVTRSEDYPWSSRRLAGRPSALVDEDALVQLLPPGALEALMREPDATIPIWEVFPDDHVDLTDEEASELLRASCGADGPEDFAILPKPDRRRAICELRTRSISYGQLARITGMSKSNVRRLHISMTGGPVGSD